MDTFLKLDAKLWTTSQIALACCGMWLVGLLPVAFVGGGYDDFLFVKLANSILGGHWLGSFDQLTLAKGPFFPFFLAISAGVGLPVHVAIEAVYLSGSLALSHVGGAVLCRTPQGRRAATTALFAVFVFNPATFDMTATQLLREDVYAGLTLLLLGLAAFVVIVRPSTRWAILLGLVAAAYWMTREEGVLILAPLCSMVAWRCWGVRPSELRPEIRAIATATLTALIAVGVVCCLNLHIYGVFRTCDFQSGPFPGAYGALSRIMPDAWTGFIPVPVDARQRAYAISGAARELRPFLEGDVGKYWTDVGCQAHPIADCHDLQAGWFMWALRNAVTSAGHYGSARDADRFYRRLAREVDLACDTRAIRCLGPRSGYVPPLRASYILPVIRSTVRVVGDIVRLGDPTPTATPSLAQGAYARAYDRVAFGSVVSASEVYEDAADWEVTGFLMSKDPTLALSVIAGAAGSAVQSDLRVIRDPAALAPGALSGRGHFFGSVRCKPADCRLQVTSHGAVIGSWPITSLKADTTLAADGATVQVESVSTLPSYASTANRQTIRRRAMTLLAGLVKLMSEVAAAPAVIWFCRRAFADLRGGHISPVLILAACVLLVSLTRIGMLAVLDATSIPLERRYLTPAIGPWLFFMALMAFDAFVKLWPEQRIAWAADGEAVPSAG